jgi:hypothetical protein
MSLLGIGSAWGQLANSGFETTKAATQPPNAGWQLKTPLLPTNWNYNVQFGGPVGVVEGGHTGKYALSVAAGEKEAHLLQGPFPVETGQWLKLSGWVKEGQASLTVYEYAENTVWLRTVPVVTTISGGQEWVQGGGYHVISDPQVRAVSFVVIVRDKSGVLLDDLALEKMTVPESTGPEVVLENPGCRMVLSAGGQVTSFYDKTLGQERAVGLGRPFMSVSLANWQVPLSSIRREGNLLQVAFGDGQARVSVEVDEQPGWIAFALKSFEPAELQSLRLVDLTVKKLATTGGSLTANYDDKAALCLRSPRYWGLPGLSAGPETATFTCTYFSRYSFREAAVVLIACPREKLLPTIQEYERAYEVPSPRLNGEWGKTSRFIERSYFFVTDLSEANVDEVIAWAKRGGYNYLLVLENAWSHGGGTYAINEKNFPRGMAGLRATVSRIQQAGFKVGLHFLAAGMRGTDPLVSPVPHDQIYTDVTAELAAALDEKATFVPTVKPPAGFPAEDGGYDGHGAVLRVGNEIITYGSLKLDPPYGFSECTRGALGTTAAAHAAGSSVKHLYKSYGLFLIDADTPLMEQVAANVARVYKGAGCDGLYFDGSERLQGDHWYYNARIQMAYYDAVGRGNVMCQGSSYSPYTWHLNSRMASADGFRDIKEYLDKRASSFHWYKSNLMPLDLGWYAINRNIRPDDIEYVLSRAVGFDASVSIQTGIGNLNSVCQSDEMFDLVGRWNHLRQAGRVPEHIKARLREIGREFTLVQRGGEQVLVPVEYSAWANSSAEEGHPAQLTLSSRRAGKPELQVQIEAGATVAPGAVYEQGQALELFEVQPPGENQTISTNMYNPSVHGSRATFQGVTQELALVTDDVKEGKTACRFTATSTLPGNNGWATFGRRFDPPLAFGPYAVIGLWVKGDGQGQLLKVQLRDAKGGWQDHYVRIDFTGWRFVELPRPSPEPLDYSQITYLNFYFNAIPARQTVSVVLDGVKVLGQATRLENPRLKLGDEEVIFPVTMSPGERIVWRGPNDCWLYRGGPGRELVRPRGVAPEFKEGLTISAPPQSHQILFRSALQWPGSGVVIPLGR